MFRFRNRCTPIALSSHSSGIAAGKKRAVQGKGAVYPFGGYRVGRTVSVAGRYRPGRAADAPFSAPDRRLRPFWRSRSLICHTYGRRSGERHTHEVGGQIPYPYISNQDYSDIQVVSYPGGRVPTARKEPPIGYRLRRCGGCFSGCRGMTDTLPYRRQGVTQRERKRCQDGGPSDGAPSFPTDGLVI